MVCCLCLSGCQKVVVNPGEEVQKEALLHSTIELGLQNNTIEMDLQHDIYEPQPQPIEQQLVDARSFIASECIGNGANAIEDKVYSGGIVPHHGIAYEMIDQFYSQLDAKSVQGIVLIGPDHQGVGSLCSVGTRSYRTHFGSVEVDPVVEDLLSEVSISEASLQLQEVEHSIALHMNYIDYYLPELPVVALYVQDRMGLTGAGELLEILYEQLPSDQYLFIGSVDFSHMQVKKVADQKDQQTLSFIEQRSYSELFSLGNDYIDSSAALVMALEGGRHYGHESIRVLEHNNAENILNQGHMSETTSYYTFGFK